MQATFGLSAVKSGTLVRVQKILGLVGLLFDKLNQLFPRYALRLQQLNIALIDRFDIETLSLSFFPLQFLSYIEGKLTKLETS